ncbi:MAG: NAD-dependent epimerase/dehydratase family protein [Alphaproteobacteria bacterium]
MAKISRIIQQDARAVAEAMAPQLAKAAGDTVIVTGAGGFLGSFLVDCLVAWNDLGAGEPMTVIAVDNMLTGLPERLAHLANRPDVELLKHDITAAWTHAGGADWIVHGASIASPPFYRQYPLETIDANVGGTRRMLDLAVDRHAKGVLVMSTSEIYGDPTPDMIPTPEDYRGNVSCTGPRACYDESKRLAETLAVTYHQLYDVPAKIIRPFNVFGPGQRIDDKRVIPDLMTAALARQPIVLFSDGRATRSFCYVADAVRGMLTVLLADVAGEAFNVGNDEQEISMLDLAKLMARIASDPPLSVTHQVSDDADYLTDNPQRRCPVLDKLRGLGWEPQVPLEEALSRTLASYAELEEAAA